MPDLLTALWNWMRAQRKGMPRRDLLEAEDDLRMVANKIFHLGAKPNNDAQ